MSIGRGCATLVFAVLLLYGVGAIVQTILPPRGNSGNELTYVVMGFVFLSLAAAVWALWLRSPGTGTAGGQIRPRNEPSLLADLIDHARKPDTTSTDYLAWPWLIRLDLAFRDHLWVRITTLLVGMVAVTLVVMLAFGAGILR